MYVPASPRLPRRAPMPALATSIALGVSWVAAVTPAVAGASNGYAYSEDDGLQWALMGPGDRVTSHMWNDDLRERLDRLRGQGRELLWVRLGDRAYVITDRDAVAEARAIVRPMSELGEQQGRLGRTQGELGRKQGRLGREQGRAGALQGRLSARLARLDASDRRERDEIREQMRALTTMQHELAEAQRPLARRQQELGERQRALGERQREASSAASREIRRLVERCVEDGTARRFED